MRQPGNGEALREPARGFRTESTLREELGQRGGNSGEEMLKYYHVETSSKSNPSKTITAQMSGRFCHSHFYPQNKDNEEMS